MGRYNADQMRAAKAEAQDTPHEMTFGGQTFTIPARPGAELLEGLGEFAYLVREGEGGDEMAQTAALRPLFRALRSVFGAKQWRRIMAQDPDLDDFMVIVEGLTTLWGLGQGESSASPSSSRNTGERSRPTSPTSTPSSSPQPSTDPTPSPSGVSTS